MVDTSFKENFPLMKFQKVETKSLISGLSKLVFKGALSSLRRFLLTENPLKMMKNAFYFILKAFLVLKIFKFLS